jgi:hypothetical protein
MREDEKGPDLNMKNVEGGRVSWLDAVWGFFVFCILYASMRTSMLGGVKQVLM